MKTKPKTKRPTAAGEGFPSAKDIEAHMRRGEGITFAIVWNKKLARFECASQGATWLTPLLVDPGQSEIGAITKPRFVFEGYEWHGRIYTTGQAVFQKTKIERVANGVGTPPATKTRGKKS